MGHTPNTHSGRHLPYEFARHLPLRCLSWLLDSVLPSAPFVGTSPGNEKWYLSARPRALVSRLKGPDSYTAPFGDTTRPSQTPSVREHLGFNSRPYYAQRPNQEFTDSARRGEQREREKRAWYQQGQPRGANESVRGEHQGLFVREVRLSVHKLTQYTTKQNGYISHIL